MTFHRGPDSMLFNYSSHDAEFFTGEDGHTYVVLTRTGHHRILFRPKDLSNNAADYVPLSGDYMWKYPGSSIDTMVQVDGVYYAYRSTRIYTSDDLLADRTPANRNWTFAGKTNFSADPGVYYEKQSGLFHLFYEAARAGNHSGTEIGHATSPNGVSNWTVHEPVYSAPPGLNVGDFEVLAVNGTYFLFGDYVRNHPRYNVSVWVNDDLYSNFTYHRAVVEPAPSEGEVGIQDPTVVHDPATGRFVMLAQAEYGNTSKVHYIPGDVEAC